MTNKDNLEKCPHCRGTGQKVEAVTHAYRHAPKAPYKACPACDGTGLKRPAKSHATASVG